MTSSPDTARIATLDDVDALVELRIELMRHFGWNGDAPGADHRWIDAVRERFTSGIASGDVVGAVVVDEANVVVAGGIAEVVPRLPSPALPEGRMAHVSSMFTREERRGAGLGRLVVRALLAELHRRGIAIVELHAASPDAERLYASEGFGPRPGGPLLRFLGAPPTGPASDG